jgi:hypothetical protein
MSHYGIMTVRDYSKELSRFKVNYDAITVVNLADLLSDWGDLKTATDAIILGVIANEQLVLDNTIISASVPASAFAQRELKLEITYVGDTSGKIFQLEVPTPDLANLTLNNTDEVVLADGGIMAAWVTAFEVIARSPDSDTETVTVTKALVKGRNI